MIIGVRWYKRLQDFGPIPGLLTYEEERRQRISEHQQKEFYNFNKAPLEITYYEDPRFFEFYDNDTKARGMYGDVWTALSEFLNFSLVLKRVESNATRGGYDGDDAAQLFEYARLNKTDIVPITVVSVHENQGAVMFSPSLWTGRLRIFGRPLWMGDDDWMFDVFAWEVWLTIVITVGLLSLACIVTQKVLKHNNVAKRGERSYFIHLFYTFASLCNQGTAPDNTGSGSRVLTLTVGLFSWMSLAAYSASMMNNLTMEVMDSRFHDLETLLQNTNLQVLVLSGSLGHFAFFRPNSSEIFGRIVRAKRVSTESNIYEAYRKVCSYPDRYVLFDEDNRVATRGKMICELIPIDTPRNPILIASAISGRVPNKDTIVIGIRKLREFGVLARIKNRYMTALKQPAMRQATRVYVDLYRVLLTFSILATGMVASIVICFIEIVVFSFDHSK